MQVVDLRAWGRLNNLAHRVVNDFRIPFAPLNELFRLFKRFVKDARLSAFVVGKILIAAAQRHAVAIPNNRFHRNFDGYVQVPDHLSNDANLLIIFLAEISDVGAHKIEQL